MNPTGDDDHRLLTPGEVKRSFGVTTRTVTRWASTGKLSTIRTPGGHRRYRAAEVRALLRANTTQAGTDSATTPDPDLRGPATHSELELK